MREERFTKKRGFTLTELVVTIAMSSIVVLGIGFVLVDSQRGWNRMYDRVYAGVVVDAYVARKAFDATVRKASTKRYVLGLGSVEVYYYADPNSDELDKYAKFYVANEQLLADYGDYDESTGNPSRLSTITLANNVTAADFSVDSSCVRMVLTLDNDRERMTVTSSAVRHNE